MTKSNTLVSFCAKRIAPAAAALVMALTGGTAFATPQQGQTILQSYLNNSYIPTIKAGATVTTVSAKEADLLLAIDLALQNGADPEDIAGGALLAVGGKARKDKDKIAPKILATIAASKNDLVSTPVLADVTGALFNANSPTTNLALSAVGKGNTIAAALKVADPAADAAKAVGAEIAAGFTSANATKDLATLLQNTSKALGTSTAASAQNVRDFVEGLFTVDPSILDIPPNGQILFIQDLTKKIAASNPAAAGAFVGGLIQADPGNVFSNPLQSDNALRDIAVFAVTPSSKVSKAVGEILAQLTGYSDKKDLAVLLVAQNPNANGKNPLIAQGLIRASSGDPTEINNIIDSFPNIDAVKFAAAAVVGSGDDAAKLDTIVTKLAGKLQASDVKNKTALGLAAIGAVGAASPEAGYTITNSVFNSAGGTFGSDAAILKYGTDIIGKIKAYASAGYVASAIVDATSNGNTNAGKISVAAALMAKASKAQNDIAQQISAPIDSGSIEAFATQFALQAQKFVQPIAVGLSLSHAGNSGVITKAVIFNGGKGAVSKANAISAAVANVVDEEYAADIAARVSSLMTVTPTAAKPLKISTVSALATALAKSIQTKPGVLLGNRMDELGELAAALVSSVVAEIAVNGGATDKLKKTENGYITAIGTAIIKTLSKTFRLSDNPNEASQSALASAEVLTASKLSADLWEARDIAGSIARVIKESTLDVARKIQLLGDGVTVGLLETALLKVSGKKNSPTYNAVRDAIAFVRNNVDLSRFETGFDFDKETDNHNG